MLSTVLSFDVKVVDGEGISVPSVEVGARYRYPTASNTWSRETTDANGYARFSDDHEEPPTEVCLYVGDDDCGTYALAEGVHITVEM